MFTSALSQCSQYTHDDVSLSFQRKEIVCRRHDVSSSPLDQSHYHRSTKENEKSKYVNSTKNFAKTAHAT